MGVAPRRRRPRLSDRAGRAQTGGQTSFASCPAPMWSTGSVMRPRAVGRCAGSRPSTGAGRSRRRVRYWVLVAHFVAGQDGSHLGRRAIGLGSLAEADRLARPDAAIVAAEAEREVAAGAGLDAPEADGSTDTTFDAAARRCRAKERRPAGALARSGRWTRGGRCPGRARLGSE